MAEAVEKVCESLKVKRFFKRKLSISNHRRSHKNALRRVRKKRNKGSYYKSLKQRRYNRQTDDLCSAVEVFDVTDMEWATAGASSSTDLPPEITEWQKQDQIAYWKSRAISLELENKMLYQHLRDVYAKTIEEYSHNSQYRQNNYYEEETQNELEEDVYHENGYTKKSGLKSHNKSSNKASKEIDECEESSSDGKEQILFQKMSPVRSNFKKKAVESSKKRSVSPKEPGGKNRLTEMQIIYGDNAQKIMGMETALQLNYEKYLDQGNPTYWPTIPFRLGFD